MVQTLTRAIKLYVSDVNKREWDEYAERLTFSLNTAQDRVLQETPFYLVHGWDPRTTLEATVPLGCSDRNDCGPRRWRYALQRHYRRARDQVNAAVQAAMNERTRAHDEDVSEHNIVAGSQVW